MRKIAIILATIMLGATGTNTFAATSAKKNVVKHTVVKKSKKIIKKAKPFAKNAPIKAAVPANKISSGSTSKIPDTTTKAS